MENELRHKKLDTTQATAHAQTYFDINPITNINDDQFLFLDGGNADNNPSWVAINFAKEHFPNIGKVFLVSLGTGDTRTPIDITKHGWHGFFTGGLAAWGEETFSILMSSTSEHVHRRVDRYLNDEKNGNYFRFNPIIVNSEQKDLDNSESENLKSLYTIAESAYTGRNSEKINSVINGLLEIDRMRTENKWLILDTPMLAEKMLAIKDSKINPWYNSIEEDQKIILPDNIFDNDIQIPNIQGIGEL
ncbi:MAG: hypothetical protein WCK42_02515 [Myxococcaceae bacterium]